MLSLFKRSHQGNIKIAGLIIGLGAIVAGGLLLYGYWLDGQVSAQFDPADETIIARVNGQEINRGRLNLQLNQLLANPQLSQQIPSPDQEDQWTEFEQLVLEDLIIEALVLQAAARLDLQATEAEIDEWLNMIIAETGEAEFDRHLTTLGISTEQLRDNIGEQLIIQSYVERLEAGQDLPTITDEEIEEFYNEQIAISPEAPALAEVTEDIRAHLAQEHLNSLILDEIRDLREAAEIEILL